MTDPDYTFLDSQLRALLAGEHDALANAANFVALLYHALDDIIWLGIYVLRNDELVLGPFQGNTACVRISIGSGVCGRRRRHSRPSALPMCTHFPVTSLVTRPLDPKSSCRC